MYMGFDQKSYLRNNADQRSLEISKRVSEGNPFPSPCSQTKAKPYALKDMLLALFLRALRSAPHTPKGKKQAVLSAKLVNRRVSHAE